MSIRTVKGRNKTFVISYDSEKSWQAFIAGMQGVQDLSLSFAMTGAD